MGLYPVSTRQLMRRFFLPDFSVDTTFVDLSPEVAHHVKTVLRLREGSDVVMAPGNALSVVWTTCQKDVALKSAGNGMNRKVPCL